MSIAADLGLQPPDDAAAILANVERVVPLIAEQAPACNAQGYMSAELGEALRAAGAYRVGFSKRRNGPEMTLAEQTRMVETVARADASVAWNVTVLAATGFYACRLGDEAFAELYPSLDLPTCGSFHPKGVARQVDGGYRVSGEWKFGSAIRSAHHIVAGVEVVGRDGEPVHKPDGSRLTLGVWLPTELVTLRDDWHVIGLAGSGSQGYAVTDAFVPEHHSFDRFFAPDPAADPLVKHVDLPFFSMVGIALGIAAHALEVTVADVAARTGERRPGERTLGLIGEAETYLRAARALAYEGVRRIDEAIFAPGGLPAELVMGRGDSPLATEFARTVLDRCSDALGSKVIYRDVPFELLMRDLVGMSAHASTWRGNWVGVGRMIVDAVQRGGGVGG